MTRCPECGFHEGYHSDDCNGPPHGQMTGVCLVRPCPEHDDVASAYRGDLCQDCWYDLFPDQYAPIMDRFDQCVQCGIWALVARSSW